MRMYDEIIRAKLNGIESEYSPNMWESIERKLDNKKPKASPWFAISTLGALILTSIICIAVIYSSAEKVFDVQHRIHDNEQEVCEPVIVASATISTKQLLSTDERKESEKVNDAVQKTTSISKAQSLNINHAPILILQLSEEDEQPLENPIILSYIDEAEDIWIREKRIISSAEDFERMDRIIYAPISKISNVDVELKSSYRSLNLDDSMTLPID